MNHIGWGGRGECPRALGKRTARQGKDRWDFGGAKDEWNWKLKHREGGVLTEFETEVRSWQSKGSKLGKNRTTK